MHGGRETLSNYHGGLALGREKLPVTHSATLGDFISVPDAHALFTGAFERAGHDLVLSGNGKTFVAKDYFAHERRLPLLSSHGAALNGKVIEFLAGPEHPTHYAQVGAPAGQNPVGRVEKATGSVTVQHANGAVVQANPGDPVYQGDVVQTGVDSSVGVSFIDGSAFSLLANARMVLNEFVYDPNTTGNSAILSIIDGTMSFVASKVAKRGEMRVETPAAIIGVRGTSGGMISASDGTIKYFLNADPDGHIGEIVLLDPINPQHIYGTISNVGLLSVFTPSGPQRFTVQEVPASAADLQAIANIISQVIAVYNLGLQSPYYQGQQQNLQPPQEHQQNNDNSDGSNKGQDSGQNANPHSTGNSSGSSTPPPVTTNGFSTITPLTTNTAVQTNLSSSGGLLFPTNGDTSGNKNSIISFGLNQQFTTTPTQSVVPETGLTIKIAAVAGGNVISASQASAGVTISGTESRADGQAVTVQIVNSDHVVVETLTTTASAGIWLVTLSSAQVKALSDGTYTVKATISDQFGSSTVTATQSVVVHETGPTIAIINASQATAGVTISGTETGADGQTVTVQVLNSGHAVVDTLTTTSSGGTWSTTLPSAQAKALGNGTYTFAATVTDQFGNASNTATQSVVVHESGPNITMAAADGNDVINASQAAMGVTISGTDTGADGQPVTVQVLNSGHAVVDTLTTTSSAGAWSTMLSSAQAKALADGTYTFAATVTDQFGNASNTATQSVVVHESGPNITMAAVDGNDVINASQAAAGVTISGTETGADGQTVTVQIVDSNKVVVDSLTTTSSGGAWSTMLSSAQAKALADGTYTFAATVTDQFGNASNTATQSVVVHEGGPNITMAAVEGNDVINASQAAAGGANQ
jgi:5-hydroxyisourate hydrolase-like protein (transthyretin family)